MDTNGQQQNNIEKYRVDGMSLKNKMDKIAAAIHMVTDCIEDNEPIRFKLRSLAVELASESHEFIYTPARDRGFIFADIEVVATEIMSFVSIAKSVRIISDMNADILLRELSANTERMRAWTETGFYEVENSDFAQPRTPVSFTLDESHFKADQSRQNRLQSSLTDAQKHTAIPEQKTEKHTSSEDQSKGQKMHQMPGATKVRQEAEDNKKFDFAVKLNRRNTILKIIKDKKEVTIKDISNLIADVSEKTIQRELITLVSEGVLKKIGEKRWSKYLLA
jgi:hypothetical protein